MIGEQCTFGYQRGDGHVRNGDDSDCFRPGDSIGLRDIRSSHPFGGPVDARYDAAMVSPH